MGNIQIFNPVHNQLIKRGSVTVMGRYHGRTMPAGMAIYLDNFLLRRVKPNLNGAFELRVELDNLAPGEHQVEIRAMVGHNTERAIVPFRLQEGAGGEADEPPGGEEEA